MSGQNNLSLKGQGMNLLLYVFLEPTAIRNNSAHALRLAGLLKSDVISFRSVTGIFSTSPTPFHRGYGQTLITALTASKYDAFALFFSQAFFLTFKWPCYFGH